VKLISIEVKNYRSLFADSSEHHDFGLDLADGMNALIGPNNCGKSNLLRAIALALDPNFPFDRTADMPGAMQYAFPRITLDFECQGRTTMERTLLRYLEEYERQFVSSGRPTYAESGLIRYTVSFPGSERSGANRQESFVARGAGARKGDPESLVKPLSQFRKILQFVLVTSGESLETLLAGKFREILHTVIRDHMKENWRPPTADEVATSSSSRRSCSRLCGTRLARSSATCFPRSRTWRWSRRCRVSTRRCPTSAST